MPPESLVKEAQGLVEASGTRMAVSGTSRMASKHTYGLHKQLIEPLSIHVGYTNSLLSL